MSTEDEPRSWGQPEKKERPKDPAHKNRQMRGVHELRGANDLKGVRGLKGVRDLKGVRGLKGAADLKGAQNLKGARDLKGAQDLRGTGTQHSGLQAGLKVVQEVVKDELQGNIRKLKTNLSNASETMKDNLQAGLQSALQTGANAIQESRGPKARGEHTNQEAEVVPAGSHEPDTKQDEHVEARKTPPRDILISLISDNKKRDELIDRLAQNIILAKSTLDKTVTAIDAVQDILKKSAPLFGEQESIQKIQEVLNKVEPGVKTARDVIDKLEPLLHEQGDATNIRDVLEKFTGSVENLQDLLGNAKERVDTLQTILRRVAVVLKAMEKVAPMIDKKSEVGTARKLFTKVNAIVKTVNLVLDKAITGVDTVQSTLDKIMALPAEHPLPTPEVEAEKAPSQKIAAPAPEVEEEKGKKEAAPEVKEAKEAKTKEKPEGKATHEAPKGKKAREEKGKPASEEDNMLKSLKKANIIKPDVHAEDLHKELESLRQNLPEEAGIIGYPGHMLFVWKEEEAEK
ncbi:hypothetical protein [Dictyobacter aurantiacus]|uniref:Uncharacterized protein n=1 Tax=Dictyobacter aurantiacus TaxID=1936993 RepID=A0A401ZGP4_9CHLR|nr:hypothetical protein [Dictyobacter aurantiacus]GCE06055.1 hypothetical protein KDAU_33840 [Dictyobacter aurantiacus]